MECVQKVYPRFENVLVPWGALHMAGLEEGLMKLGFHVVESREVMMLEWREMAAWLTKFRELP
jgi:hypothetical protein